MTAKPDNAPAVATSTGVRRRVSRAVELMPLVSQAPPRSASAGPGTPRVAQRASDCPIRVAKRIGGARTPPQLFPLMKDAPRPNWTPVAPPLTTGSTRPEAPHRELLREPSGGPANMSRASFFHVCGKLRLRDINLPEPCSTDFLALSARRNSLSQMTQRFYYARYGIDDVRTSTPDHSPLGE